MPITTVPMLTAMVNTFCFVAACNAIPTISKSRLPEAKPIAVYIPFCVELFQVSESKRKSIFNFSIKFIIRNRY